MHNWRILDEERGIEVRLLVEGHSKRRWEVRRADRGVVVHLDESEFDRLRSQDWLPEELR